MRFFQKHQKRILAAIAVLLVALMLLPIVTMAINASAVTQSEIDALKEDSAKLAEQKKELNSQLSALEGEIDSALSQKLVVEQEISVVTDQISTTQALIDQYDGLIAEQEVKLAEAEEQESVYYDEFCRRVRAMEEEGNVTYWEILFNAANFNDLLDRAMMISEVVEYDNGVMKALKQARQDVEDAKAALEEAQAEQVAAKEELDAQKAELDSKNAQVAALLQELEAKQDVYESQIDELDSQMEEIDGEIAAKQKEYQKQIEEALRAQAEARARAQAQAQANSGSSSSGSSSSGTSSSSSSTASTASNSQYNTGSGYMWPLSGRYTLSSLFGNRIHPITGRPNSHTGIDIPASYGASIYASRGGVVITSTYNSSYGNYVVVSHGNNDSTLYAHMSSRAVSVGQTVSQGDVLGYVGSTGSSTGNHLHFEVRLNGVRTDPVNQFPNLTLYVSASGRTVVLDH